MFIKPLIFLVECLNELEGSDQPGLFLAESENLNQSLFINDICSVKVINSLLEALPILLNNATNHRKSTVNVLCI